MIFNIILYTFYTKFCHPIILHRARVYCTLAPVGTYANKCPLVLIMHYFLSDQSSFRSTFSMYVPLRIYVSDVSHIISGLICPNKQTKRQMLHWSGCCRRLPTGSISYSTEYISTSSGNKFQQMIMKFWCKQSKYKWIHDGNKHWN